MPEPDSAARTGGMYSYVVADVFTERPLEGNPVAVFTDGRGLRGERMQQAARELNLSETVFVLPPEEGGDARVRIFTPVSELPFAGHPVLGTAFVVAAARAPAGSPPAGRVRLETGSGVITLDLERDGTRITFGRMAQPIPLWEPFARADELLGALGVERAALPVEIYSNGPRHVYVALDSPDAVAALRPDPGAVAALVDGGVSCFAGSGRQWKTRMFAPALGVHEDPATGSAAGPLAVHLTRHGRVPYGAEVEIRQGAEIGRPSVLYARAHGTAGPSGARIERVEVGGAAVVVARGEYLLA